MVNKQINEVKATDSTVYVSTKNHKGNAHQNDIRNNDSTCVSQATTNDSFVVTSPSNTTAPIASKKILEKVTVAVAKGKAIVLKKS